MQLPMPLLCVSGLLCHEVRVASGPLPMQLLSRLSTFAGWAAGSLPRSLCLT